jgi:hypothetical protein
LKKGKENNSSKKGDDSYSNLTTLFEIKFFRKNRKTSIEENTILKKKTILQKKEKKTILQKKGDDSSLIKENE